MLNGREGDESKIVSKGARRRTCEDTEMLFGDVPLLLEK